MDKLTQDGVITILNDGQDITSTNYFDTANAKAGVIQFSVNAGCIRALVPPATAYAIPEMRTGKQVILSRGPLPDQGRDDAFEIMFEDFSDNPFALHVGVDQWDMVPEPGDKWTFAVWTDAGKVWTCDKVLVRRAESLPWLKAWDHE